MITHLFTSAYTCRSISRTRTLKLCLALPTSLTLCLVTFSCSQTSESVLLSEDSTQDHSSDQPFSSVFHIILKIEFKRAFLKWVEILWKCVAADGRTACKVAVAESRLRWREHTFYIMYLTQEWSTFTTPSYESDTKLHMQWAIWLYSCDNPFSSVWEDRTAPVVWAMRDRFVQSVRTIFTTG